MGAPSLKLFRDQSEADRPQDDLGSPDLVPARLSLPLFALPAALVATVIALAALGSYTRSEPAQGQLVPSEGLHAIASPTGGVLARVLVKEGDAIASGQPLFEVASHAEGPGTEQPLDRVVAAELHRKKQLLEEDLIYINASDIGREQRVEEEIAFLEEKLRSLNSQLNIKRQQAATAGELYARARSLDAGMLTAIQLQQYESAAMEARVAMEDMAQARRVTERELLLARRQRGSISTATNERRNSIRRQLSDVTEALARNAQQNGRLVRASRSGTVTMVSRSTGQPVKPGTHVITLMPAGSRLQAELWVTSRAIGQVRPGQPVRLRYDAFPHQLFGLQSGTIVRVAGSSLDPQDIRAMSGRTMSSPAYRVLVDLDRQFVLVGNRRVPLKPDVKVDAEILLERRPAYALLLPATMASTAPGQATKADGGS